MAIEGPLQEFSLEDVLQLLEMSRKTGILHLRSELLRDEAEVHLDGGAIVFARRAGASHRLGQQLLRAGKITEGELKRALEIQREGAGGRLGEVLLELGSVSREVLEEQLRFQCEEAMYDLMGWGEGHFRFDEQETPDRAPVNIAVRVESLLMEGARRIDEWTRLESKVPSAEAVPVLAPAEDDAPALDLRPDEWEVLAEIDGERDVREIAAVLGRSTFDAAKIVYALVTTGVLTVYDESPRLPERELDAAMREVRDLLRRGEPDEALEQADALQATNPDDPELARLYGSALRGTGRLRAATEAFARAASLDPLSTESHYRLGFAAARIGEFERASQAWNTMLRLSSNEDRREIVRRGLAALESLAESLAYEPDGMS